MFHLLREQKNICRKIWKYLFIAKSTFLFFTWNKIWRSKNFSAAKIRSVDFEMSPKSRFLPLLKLIMYITTGGRAKCVRLPMKIWHILLLTPANLFTQILINNKKSVKCVALQAERKIEWKFMIYEKVTRGFNDASHFIFFLLFSDKNH